MNKDKYVFAQLIEFLDNNKCWNQLLAMMFGQLSNRESLRDLIVAFEAHRAKQYHLGLGVSLLRKRHLLLPIRIVTTVSLKTLLSILWSRPERNV